MLKLSFNGKRIVAGIATLMTLLCLANYYFNLGLLGRFGKEVLIVSIILLFVCVYHVGPTIEEIRRYRDSKRSSMK